MIVGYAVGVSEPRTATYVQLHGPALRHIRKGAGRTTSSLARASGVHASQLRHIERGSQRTVRVEVWRAICTELNLADGRVLLANPYDQHHQLDAAA